LGRLPVYITIYAALAVLPSLFSNPASADPALLNRCADAGLSYEIRAAACSAFADHETSKERQSAAFALWAFAEIDSDNPGLSIARADTALKLYPHNYLAMAARGWGYLAFGNFDRARSNFYDAGRYDSENARMHSNLGLSVMAWEFDSYALTKQLAADVLDVEAHHLYALYLHGASAGALGDFDQGLKDAGTLISTYPSDPTGWELRALLHHNRAIKFDKSSDYATAILAYETALSLSEPAKVSLLRRYSWLLSTGPTGVRNSKKALALANQMMEEAGRKVRVHRQLALVHHTFAVALAANGNLREAEIEFDNVIEVFPSARSRLQKALAKAGYLKQTPSATLYELLGAIHACLETSCDALSVPLIYKTL